MIGGGAKKPVERAFGAGGDSRRSRRAYLNDGRELLLFLQSLSVVPRAMVSAAWRVRGNRPRQTVLRPFGSKQPISDNLVV